jgi:hypothetical protein
MRFVLDTQGDSVLSSANTLTDDNSDQAIYGDVARQQTGLTGAGVKVGILSDSFDLKGGYATDVADGNLPAGIQVLEEGASGEDEGRAMAELVHKVAPDAQIMFHTATGSEADFASGITTLADAGCSVIVDDVAYLDEPFFQDGSPLQQAVEQVVSQGVSYFTSASNEGTDFFQAAFQPISTPLPGLPGIWNLANFGGAGSQLPYLELTVPRNGSFAIDLQWDQPFATIGSGHGSANSLGMALYTGSGQLIGTAGGLGVGGNPEQLLEYTNTSGQTDLKLAVVANSFAEPDLFKLIVYGNATIDNAQAGQGSGTVTGHEMVEGANTVGAMDWSSAPRFGGNDTTEAFSSVGSGEELFDASGNRLPSPVYTDKVSFDAPDGSMTSVFAPFFGTSAAAPNAAAVAALMQQANPDLTPGQISTMMAESAVTANGPAGGVGAGLINAPGAVQLALASVHHG